MRCEGEEDARGASASAMLVAHMQALKRKSGESKPHLLVAHQVEGVEDIEKDDGPDDNAERRSHDSRDGGAAGFLFSFVGFDGKSATDIAQGPIARVTMPHRVPVGFHATWAAGEDLYG